jgi:ADP-heptose:LPS heptosyltransferase
MSTAQGQEKVVIYRLGSLGDTVVTLPCFHKVAQTWPHAQRIVLTNFPVSSKAAPLQSILGNSGLIHGAIAYPVGTRSPRRLWRLARELRATGARTLVYLTEARGKAAALRDWLFFRLAGFRTIVGIPWTTDLQGRREPPPGADPSAEIERECERLARCIRGLGPVDLTDPRMWDLRLQSAEIEAGDRTVAPLDGCPYFAINMGGKAKEKDWGLARWLDMLRALGAQHPGAGLLIIGAAEDSPRAQEVAGVWPGPTVDACGKLSPRESAAAMRHALAFIGHDSGPLHLAAATGVPCVGIFGNYNRPRRWHPLGEQHHIIHRMTGLDTITPQDVLSAVASATATRTAGAHR